MLVLKDTTAVCSDLVAFLTKHEIEIEQIIELKKKSPHYKSFVVECNEAYFNDFFDRDLWDPDTLIREYRGTPVPDQVQCTYPQRG